MGRSLRGFDLVLPEPHSVRKEHGMPNKSNDKLVELLEKLIALRLYSIGASQDITSGFLSRSKTWVNDLLKGLPKIRKPVAQTSRPSKFFLLNILLDKQPSLW